MGVSRAQFEQDFGTWSLWRAYPENGDAPELEVRLPDGTRLTGDAAEIWVDLHNGNTPDDIIQAHREMILQTVALFEKHGRSA